jgi:GNAT superfamily N-acetyltransferase
LGVTLDLVRTGAGRLRVGAWRGSDRIAYVAPVPDGIPADAATVRRACAVLAGRGYTQVVTAALAPHEVRGFLAAGFTIREHLHLLSRDGDSLPERPTLAAGRTLRRGRHGDRAAVLAVDARSFPPFWRLDADGLVEAMRATPSSRWRVAVETTATGEERIAGYAVCGRAGRRGFVQRLAVDAPARRGGVGAALVIDGLRWLRRWGTTRTVVNTQTGNEGALALYEALGFRREPGGLVVLAAVLR